MRGSVAQALPRKSPFGNSNVGISDDMEKLEKLVNEMEKNSGNGKKDAIVKKIAQARKEFRPLGGAIFNLARSMPTL